MASVLMSNLDRPAALLRRQPDAPGVGVYFRPSSPPLAPRTTQIRGHTMNDNVTFERLQDIIAETLKVDKERVTAEASFQDDLKADSLDLVELIMAFEDEYGVEIPDEDAQKIRTVGQALEYVQAHGK